MADLTNEERETHYNISAANRHIVEVTSDDPVEQRAIEKVGGVAYQVRGDTKYYRLPRNQFSLRNPPKPMPEEKRAALAERLAKMREGKNVSA